MELAKEYVGGLRMERIVHGLGAWVVHNWYLGTMKEICADDGFGELVPVGVAGAYHYVTN